MAAVRGSGEGTHPPTHLSVTAQVAAGSSLPPPMEGGDLFNYIAMKHQDTLLTSRGDPKT